MLNRMRTVTLHNLCLQVIAQNLVKFIQSRNVPQRHIDFLLHHYSEDVFRVINHFHGINEETMLWFLNPRCKNVTLPIASEKIIQRLQVVGPVITSLNLSKTLASEEMLKSIVCCIANVTQLDLSESLCSDETLLCVMEMCCSLVNLNLHDCKQITDNGMKKLSCSVLQLIHLNLFGTSITYKGLSEILNGIPSLQYLKHDKLAESLYNIHKSNISFKVSYNLRELIYNESSSVCNPKDVLQACTTMCPKVTKVHISFISYEILEICSKFEHLTELEVKYKIIEGLDSFFRDKSVLVPFVSRASMLSRLILYNLKINIVTLLQNFKNLQILNLRCVYFTECEEIKLEENKIKDLTIEGDFKTYPTNYKAISLLLSVSKHVTNLTLNPWDYDCVSEDSGIEILELVLNSMKNLAYVDLRAYDVRPIDPRYLFRFYELPSLKIIHSVDYPNKYFPRYPKSTLAWQGCYFYPDFVVPGFQRVALKDEPFRRRLSSS